MEQTKEKRPQGRPKSDPSQVINARLPVATVKKLDELAKTNGNSRYAELIKIVKKAVGDE